MQDEFYDRYYQAGRAELHAGLDQGVRAIGRFVAGTFNALHDVQFGAPWKASAAAKPRRRAGIA